MLINSDPDNTYKRIRLLRAMCIHFQLWQGITKYDDFIKFNLTSAPDILKARENIYQRMANNYHQTLWGKDDAIENIYQQLANNYHQTFWGKDGAIDTYTQQIKNKSLQIASQYPNTIMALNQLIQDLCFQSYITLLCSAKMNTDKIIEMGTKVKQYKDAVKEYKTYYAACTSIQSVWRGAQHRIAKNKSIKKDAKP